MSARRWKTRGGVIVIERGRRTDERGVKIAAYREGTGGWHGWLHVTKLERCSAKGLRLLGVL